MKNKSTMKKPKLVNKGKKKSNFINIPNIFLTNYQEKPLKQDTYLY